MEKLINLRINMDTVQFLAKECTVREISAFISAASKYGPIEDKGFVYHSYGSVDRPLSCES